MPAADFPPERTTTVAVVGAGPAGLMAATVLGRAGLEVDLYDRMPRPGLKLLVAGRGGLNLTKEEPPALFAEKYGGEAPRFARLLEAFSPEALRDFLKDLGFTTFTGTSRRVFPRDPVTAHLLAAWTAHLADLGVRFRLRHQWLGFSGDGGLRFLREGKEHVCTHPPTSILALGGGSWPRTGSRGDWVEVFRRRGIGVTPLAPANCGFEADWSPSFRDRFAGSPLKKVRLGTVSGATATGDLIITRYGIEGGPVYTLCRPLREELAATGKATLLLDLKPDLTPEVVSQRLAPPWNKESLANVLRKRLKLAGPVPALLRHSCPAADLRAAEVVARLVKQLPLPLTGIRPLAEAISSAGGVQFAEVDECLMLTKRPGVFVAGEMLDWEAPTGGYLLQGAFSTGHRAALGVLGWLARIGV